MSRVPYATLCDDRILHDARVNPAEQWPTGFHHKGHPIVVIDGLLWVCCPWFPAVWSWGVDRGNLAATVFVRPVVGLLFTPK